VLGGDLLHLAFQEPDGNLLLGGPGAASRDSGITISEHAAHS
jgi:prophage tail gpP-like protein